MAFNYLDVRPRQKIETTVGDILGTSGTFDISTGTAGVSAVDGFIGLDSSAQNFLPLVLVNKDALAEWEVGIYRRDSAGSNDTLERGAGTESYVLDSSSGGGWVNFTSGTKEVFSFDLDLLLSDYRIESDASGISSLIKYDSYSAPDFNDGQPAIIPTVGLVGRGIVARTPSYPFVRERVCVGKETSSDTTTALMQIDMDAQNSRYVAVEGRVLLLDPGNPGDVKLQSFKALAKYNNLTPTIAIVGVPSITTDFEDASLSSATLSIALSGNNLELRGTGLAATTIVWSFDVAILAVRG